MFRWLIEHGGADWPRQFLSLADGISADRDCGPIVSAVLEPEAKVAATPERLAWMLRNHDRLAPQDGKKWRALRKRVSDPTAVNAAIQHLDSGTAAGVKKSLRLEGATCADCLVRCQRAIIWVEGKRYDWLSTNTTWDSARDQLARNMEAVWSCAKVERLDYFVVLCHEHALKHHEQSLVKGYRDGTWSAGLPHLSEQQRTEFAKRIGTLTWSKMTTHWPDLRGLPELADLHEQ
jgi:hypothetical protein